MAYIPTFCDACSSSALRAAQVIRSGLAVCDGCGAEARPIPGASYAEADIPLYSELANALRAARITPAAAVRLLNEASAATHSPPGPVLKHLAGTVPSLSVFETYSQPDRVRKVNAMLATILHGFGTGRSSDRPPPGGGAGKDGDRGPPI